MWDGTIKSDLKWPFWPKMFLPLTVHMASTTIDMTFEKMRSFCCIFRMLEGASWSGMLFWCLENQVWMYWTVIRIRCATLILWKIICLHFLMITCLYSSSINRIMPPICQSLSLRLFCRPEGLPYVVAILLFRPHSGGERLKFVCKCSLCQ